MIYDKRLYSYKLGKETQIDLIFITKKAIFVVEAKNWSEFIKGDYNDSRWTGKGLAKNVMSVVSPYLQNLMHVRTLRNSAFRGGIVLPPIYNVICLPDGTDLITDCTEVCNYSTLESKIRSTLDGLEREYDLFEIVKVIRKLS